MIFAPAFTSHSYGVLGNLVYWQAKISMFVTIIQSSKYETGLWEEKNKSMDVQHIWETQYIAHHILLLRNKMSLPANLDLMAASKWMLNTAIQIKLGFSATKWINNQFKTYGQTQVPGPVAST